MEKPPPAISEIRAPSVADQTLLPAAPLAIGAAPSLRLLGNHRYIRLEMGRVYRDMRNQPGYAAIGAKLIFALRMLSEQLDRERTEADSFVPASVPPERAPELERSSMSHAAELVTREIERITSAPHRAPGHNGHGSSSAP